MTGTRRSLRTEIVFNLIDSMSSPNLANVLSWGLLQFPVLFADFSTIMTSLDSGNIVCLENITDKSLGLYLGKVFKLLPLKFVSGRGWSKDPENPIHSISGYILNELLTLKAIVQPSDLNPSQNLSSKTAPGVIKDIMIAYPDISQEIPAILEDMIGGAEVELGGIENAEIARLLGTFFDALGFKKGDDSDNSDDEETESSSRRLRPEDDRGRASLRYMLNVFRSSEKFGPLKNVNAKDPMTQSSSSSSSSSSSRANRGAHTATSTKAGSSDDSSSDHDHADANDDDDDDDDDVEVSAPRVGPLMPTAAQFAAAQKAGEVINDIFFYVLFCNQQLFFYCF